MFRYLALLWQPNVVDEEEQAAYLSARLLALSVGWQVAMQTRGLQVLCAGAPSGSLRIHNMHEGYGVVLGALFSRPDSSESKATQAEGYINERTSKRILTTRGEHLIKSYWGNYVAFFCDPLSGVRWALKDPCGALPCLVTRSGEVSVVFSCISDCVQLGLKLSTSWAYVHEHVLSAGRNRIATSLTEVSRVHGGELIEFRPHEPTKRSTRSMLWNPMCFTTRADELEKPEHAAQVLRETVRSCTHAWASSHASLVHRLSGGLDSSIILGCLRDAPSKPDITACTYFVPGARADERPWARRAAQFVGCKHREVPFDPLRVRLDYLPRLQPTVEPTRVRDLLRRIDVEQPLVDECSATAVFTGLGGDSGFCSDSKAFAVIEYLQRHGLRLPAVRVAAHVAHATQLTQWYVLLRSITIWLVQPRMRDQRAAIASASQLVSRSVRESVVEQARFPHPWFHDSSGVPWATIRRLGELPYHPEFYDPTLTADVPAAEIISPLYSQPAIELFLRIPLYLHFHEGRDRGLARRAFRGDVPDVILDRDWKDRAPEYVGQLVHANLDFLREMLLDGILVCEGILDRKAVEQALSPSALRGVGYPGEILRHLDTELWLRTWRAVSGDHWLV